MQPGDLLLHGEDRRLQLRSLQPRDVGADQPVGRHPHLVHRTPEHAFYGARPGREMTLFYKD